MTGYNVAHGDTEAVQLDLNNDEFAYREYMHIINRTCWFDEEDNTWNSVQEAANRVELFVREIQSGKRIPEFGEIFDADLSTVDFRLIVAEVLAEENIQEKRPSTLGLEDYLTD